MLRFIQLLAVVGIVLLCRHFWNRYHASRQASQPEPLPENMVSCKYCGLHVPQKEALQNQQAWYCCKEHLLRQQKP